MIGYCYVCGDILHRGHILFLKTCKSLCDKLICGVLTDEAIMEKKPAPIISFEERLLLVDSIKYVDIAMPQSTYKPTQNCKLIEPDILFESQSHEEYGYNGDRKIICLPYYKDQSSTNIKRKVINGLKN